MGLFEDKIVAGCVAYLLLFFGGVTAVGLSGSSAPSPPPLALPADLLAGAAAAASPSATATPQVQPTPKPKPKAPTSPKATRKPTPKPTVRAGDYCTALRDFVAVPMPEDKDIRSARPAELKRMMHITTRLGKVAPTRHRNFWRAYSALLGTVLDGTADDAGIFGFAIMYGGQMADIEADAKKSCGIIVPS